MQEEDNLTKLLPENLQSALARKGWTQAQLAQHSGVLQGNISHYLTGRSSPRAAQLHMIASALGVTMEWLLTGTGNLDLKPDAFPPINKNALQKTIEEAKNAIARLERQLDA